MTTPNPQAGVNVRNSAVAVLEQLYCTLDQIDQSQYIAPGPSGATIGAHVRHSLDHFRKLIDGYTESTVVAYDHRDRGGTIETDRAAATTEARSLANTINQLDETQINFPVRICAMVCGDGTETEIDSTLIRELWFATHHAIHHNALLKPIAAACGLDLPAEFGRAPSTLNHEQANA